MDLKELSKNLHFIIMPSSLWAVHTDPQCQYIAIFHIHCKLFANVEIDKGIVITFNNATRMKTVSFVVQNSFVEIPSANNVISNISDLTNLIYYIHDLKICPNARHKLQYPECAKYISFEKYKLCPACLSKDKGNETEKGCNILGMEIFNGVKSPDYLNLENTKVVNSDVQDFPNINTSNLCSKTFRQEWRLKEHLLTHSTENQLQCDICNKTFSKSFNLKLHMKTHTGIRSYTCSLCKKTYTTPSNLSTHIRSTHTNKKPYICSNCGMSFVHPYRLRVHMRKHTGEKPYECSICEKSFAKNIHLTVHVRTHTGEKPYMCTFCRKCFTTTGNLSSHKRVHHRDINDGLTK